ncbi:MAG: superinfection immunity protein [Candidatus Hydrogenedentes bacterium]|nr:superinfection immunity protein [Candidatus Hydrogenedentota bacterium]
MVVLVCFAFVYFFPMCIAIGTHHRNVDAIVALNIFLGWTLIGWVIALVWALADNRR